MPRLLRRTVVSHHKSGAAIGAMAASAASGALVSAAPAVTSATLAAVAGVTLLLFPWTLAPAFAHSGIWTTYSGDSSLPVVATMALFSMALVSAVVRRGDAVLLRAPRTAAIVLPVLGYSIARVLADDSSAAVVKAVRVCFFIVGALLIADVLTGDDRRLMRSQVWVAALGALAAVVAIVKAGSLPPVADLQVLGENRIVFGRSVGLAFVIAVCLVVQSSTRLHRQMWLVAAGILFIATLFSGSRGALVASIGALASTALTTAWCRRRHGLKTRSRLRIAVLAALVGVVVFAIYAGSPQADRLASLMAPGSDVTTVARSVALEGAWEDFLEKPLFGNGFASFGAIVQVGVSASALSYPHNLELEVLAELGLVGLAVFGAVMICALRAAFSIMRQPDGSPIAVILFAGLMFFLLSSQFSGDLQINRNLWFYAFLTLGAETRQR